MTIPYHKDAFGKAITQYYNEPFEGNITVKAEYFEDDYIPIPYLFRSFNEMPLIEQEALSLCKGKVLDVGAGAGCHSIYLKEKGYDVKSIDISPGAVDTMSKRGLNATLENIYNHKGNYDTILMLMNGIGIAQDLYGLEKLLIHLKSILKPNGQIILDSSDISYLYEDENGIIILPSTEEYFGIVKYQMEFDRIKTDEFNWLYIEFDILKELCTKLKLNISLIKETDNSNYLVRMF